MPKVPACEEDPRPRPPTSSSSEDSSADESDENSETSGDDANKNTNSKETSPENSDDESFSELQDFCEVAHSDTRHTAPTLPGSLQGMAPPLPIANSAVCKQQQAPAASGLAQTCLDTAGKVLLWTAAAMRHQPQSPTPKTNDDDGSFLDVTRPDDAGILLPHQTQPNYIKNLNPIPVALLTPYEQPNYVLHSNLVLDNVPYAQNLFVMWLLRYQLVFDGKDSAMPLDLDCLQLTVSQTNRYFEDKKTEWYSIVNHFISLVEETTMPPKAATSPKSLIDFAIKRINEDEKINLLCEYCNQKKAQRTGDTLTEELHLILNLLFFELHESYLLEQTPRSIQRATNIPELLLYFLDGSNESPASCDIDDVLNMLYFACRPQQATTTTRYPFLDLIIRVLLFAGEKPKPVPTRLPVLPMLHSTQHISTCIKNLKKRVTEKLPITSTMKP